MSSTNLPSINQTPRTYRGLLDFLRREIFVKSKLKDKRYKGKIYNYSESKDENEFIIELIDQNLLKYSMTGFGSGIKVGDFVAIDEKNLIKYQVEDIDYFFEPPDMWIAIVKECKR
jgi:hypothetical protein